MRLEPSFETVIFGIKIPKNIKDDFESIAKKMGLNSSHLARIIIKNFVEKNKSVS